MSCPVYLELGNTQASPPSWAFLHILFHPLSPSDSLVFEPAVHRVTDCVPVREEDSSGDLSLREWPLTGQGGQPQRGGGLGMGQDHHLLISGLGVLCSRSRDLSVTPISRQV